MAPTYSSPGQLVVTVLGVVAFERGGQEVVDLVVAHVQAAALLLSKLDEGIGSARPWMKTCQRWGWPSTRS